MRAYDTSKTSKERLVATLDRGKWVHDRQAHETREMVTDPEANFYRQVWRDPTTEDITFSKGGRLKDQSIHGPASHVQTYPSGRGPDDEEPGTDL